MNRTCKKCHITKAMKQGEKNWFGLTYKFFDDVGWQYELTIEGRWVVSVSCEECPYELERMMADDSQKKA